MSGNSVGGPKSEAYIIANSEILPANFGGVQLPKTGSAGHKTMQLSLPYDLSMYGRNAIEKASINTLKIVKNTIWGFGTSCPSGSVGYYFASEYYTAPKMPEGFKYGLYHANFRNAYCCFRSDKYGQFRDMLEQRPDTRFLKSKLGRMTRLSAPVVSNFVSADGSPVTPSKTSCSNLNNYTTSSLPYFDGVARNRGPIITADLGMAVVSI